MAKRVVVKIGSSLLSKENGALAYDKLTSHVRALSEFAAAGYEVVLVSSGAIAAGFGILGFQHRPETVAGLQASAAIGQGLLMHAYRETFNECHREVAQLLLTRNDFARRESYRNVLNAIEMLLEKGVVPIINENDTVTLRQHGFGDNDMLSALVSALVHADMLCILTDAKGVFDKDPKRFDDAKVLRHIPEVTEKLLEDVDTTGSKLGTGGMRAKLHAAKNALRMGVPVFIGSGIGVEGKRLVAIVEGQDN
ncbi:MAG: glutamate 5-kinase, partial [Bdellovibrionales bacterium]|nr:glutamate 5-kinase [Bdellovibrionales bacterium]